MGYSYHRVTGALVCDRCGAAEGKTRKRACPVNWCPPSALCPECWQAEKASDAWKQAHADCPTQQAEYRAVGALLPAPAYFYGEG